MCVHLRERGIVCGMNEFARNVRRLPYVVVWLWVASIPVGVFLPDMLKFTIVPATALLILLLALSLLGFDPEDE